MGDQPVDLALILSIHLIQQVESENMLTDKYFIAVLKRLFRDRLAVEKSAVPRSEVRQNKLGRLQFIVEASIDTSMLSRNLGIIYPNVGLDGTAEYHLFPVERDRRSDQLARQKDERRTQVALGTFGFGHICKAG